MNDAFTERGESTLAKIVVTVLIGLAAAVVVNSAANPEPKYTFVDELTSDDVGRELKLHGWVLAGSIRKIDGGYTLFVQKSGKKVFVIGSGPLPDTVKDQSEVIVYGTLVAPDVIVAERSLIAKCRTHYEGSLPDRNIKFE